MCRTFPLVLALPQLFPLLTSTSPFCRQKTTCANRFLFSTCHSTSDFLLHPLPCCSYQRKGHLRLYEDDISVSRLCGVKRNVRYLLFAAAMPFHLTHYWTPTTTPLTRPNSPSVFIFIVVQMLHDWVGSLAAEGGLTLQGHALATLE